MKKLIIELELSDDADSGAVENFVDNMLDAGTLQDEINSEFGGEGEDDDEDGERAVVNASCHIEHASPSARLQLAREIISRSESETDCNTSDDARALALLVIGEEG